MTEWELIRGFIQEGRRFDAILEWVDDDGNMCRLVLDLPALIDSHRALRDSHRALRDALVAVRLGDWIELDRLIADADAIERGAS